ncbi:MAG: hypothetical protein M1831_005058 [Alyxoria varia]|nr:MAG: hypothetical protein M1831_005058 [Alyxoria varia]
MNTKAQSSHRLPTVSASQALLESEPKASRDISLGSEGLDNLILGDRIDHGNRCRGGLPAGQVTEVLGPPGAGKTAFCGVAKVLIKLDGLFCVDGATPLPIARLGQILTGAKSTSSQRQQDSSEHDRLSNITHYRLRTLAHLQALLTKFQTATSFQSHVKLVVIESISSLLEAAYPPESSYGPRVFHKTKQGRMITQRERLGAVVSDVSESLMRIAAMHNIVVMVSNHMITKVRSSAQAVLRPPIAGQDWESAMNLRIMIYREWGQDNGHHYNQPLHRRASPRAVRFAYAMKVNGSTASIKDGQNGLLAFVINDSGIWPLPEVTVYCIPVAHAATAFSDGPATSLSRSSMQKRPFSDISGASESEIGRQGDHSGIDDIQGNESDDYGWEEEEEAGYIGVPNGGPADEYVATTTAVGQTEGPNSISETQQAET